VCVSVCKKTRDSCFDYNIDRLITSLNVNVFTHPPTNLWNQQEPRSWGSGSIWVLHVHGLGSMGVSFLSRSVCWLIVLLACLLIVQRHFQHK